jgi:small subunit ribosomal protein S6
MHQYELSVVYPTEEDQYQAGREAVLAALEANGAEILKTDELGERALAYEVKRRRRGRYVFYTIKLNPDKVTVLDRIFKLNANLLRYLFIRVDE